MPKKFQVQSRMRKLNVPIDKLSNVIFSFNPSQYAGFVQNHVQGRCREFVKKGKKILTPYWLENVDGYENYRQLDGFHREVLFRAISWYEQGYRSVTIGMTLSSLSGEEKSRVHKAQYDAIVEAFKKLMSTIITVELEPLLKASPKYRNNFKGGNFTKLTSALLPCKFLESEINGQQTLMVEFLDESPLMTVAKMKKQVLTYDATPLAVPRQRCTERVIVVKNYLLFRIELLKQKRLQNSIISLERIYRECGCEDADRRQKQGVRDAVKTTLKNFIHVGVIIGYKFVKRNDKLHGAKIFLS